MPHEDDIRVKNIFRTIGDKNDLKLRVFDRSSDDNKYWSNNGLTFTFDDLPYGSSDCAWYFDEPWIVNNEKIAEQKPAIVVEGTFGPERGNVGSAQYARFSHVLGPALNGVLAIYLLPQYAEYAGKLAKWRYDLVLACANFSLNNQGPGKILIIDAYKPQELDELVSAVSQKNVHKVNSILSQHIVSMCKYGIDEFNKLYKVQKQNSFMTEEDLDLLINDKRRYYLYSDDETIGKIMMFNRKAFTESSQRNGHTILGDALINRYWLDRKVNLIFPRLDHNDLDYLDNKNSKEWNILRKRNDINILTFDDFNIRNTMLSQRLKDIKWERNIATIKNRIIKEFKSEYINNRIELI